MGVRQKIADIRSEGALKDNAVIVRAGKNSTHPMWVADRNTSFDLLVVAYEDIPQDAASCGDRYVMIPGRKVAGWHKFFVDHPDILKQYRYIALLDDDIECDACSLNTSFELGRKFNLTVWQPSLSAESYFSYAITVTNPCFVIRYVNYVEMMCPFFNTSFLREIVPLFSAGYETGVDRLWSVCCPDPRRSCAIIDAISVHHRRPVGENRAAQGFVGAYATYEAVLSELHKNTGVKQRQPMTFSGITKGRRLLNDRLLVCLLSLTPLLWFHRLNGPRPMRKFASLTKANWRNQPLQQIDAKELVPSVKRLSKRLVGAAT